MKKYLLALMLLSGFSAMAGANPTHGKEKNLNPSLAMTAESTVAMTLQQLQEENARLKNQVMMLTNENEELKGTISFQKTMNGLMTILSQQKNQDQLEELEAQISYQKTMSNMLLMLKANNR